MQQKLYGSVRAGFYGPDSRFTKNFSNMHRQCFLIIILDGRYRGLQFP